MSVNSQSPRGEQTVLTVLVVEDDPSLRMLCRVNLELDHYRVLEAETVTRAEEIVAIEEIDIVLLDLHLGERDGRELLPALREKRPQAAVCLLSGTSENDPPAQEGIDAFIRKPFELDELAATMKRLLSTEAAQS